MTWPFHHTFPQKLDPGRLNLEKVSSYGQGVADEVLIFVSVAGDAFVRELDVSKITLRLRAKEDKKGEGNSDSTIAKLTGSTLETLQRCLVSTAVIHYMHLSNSRHSVQTYRARTERCGWVNLQSYCELEIHSSQDAT